MVRVWGYFLMPILGVIASSKLTASGSYDFIASGTGGGTSITFSSIPQTYTHLEVRYSLRNGSNGANGTSIVKMILNGVNTSNNYSRQLLYGSQSTVAQNGLTNYEYADAGVYFGSAAETNAYTTGVINISDYTSTTRLKSWNSRSAGVQTVQESQVWISSGSFYGSTAAITSIALATGDSSTWNSNSFAALYGIKGA